MQSSDDEDMNVRLRVPFSRASVAVVRTGPCALKCLVDLLQRLTVRTPLVASLFGVVLIDAHTFALLNFDVHL